MIGRAFAREVCMLEDKDDNAVVSDRLDRAVSGLACLLASTSAVGTWHIGRWAYESCPFSEACAPAVLATLFGCVMSLALFGACYLFKPRD
jgi:hypothetical protein